MKRSFALLILAATLGGCASVDQQDRFILGEATGENIALQSPRDVNLPNMKHVETISGVRAARNVKALNEGNTKALAESGVSDAGGE